MSEMKSLLFGDDYCKSAGSKNDLEDLFSGFCPSIRQVDYMPHVDRVFMKMSSLGVPGLVVRNIMSSPLRLRVETNKKDGDFSMLISMEGNELVKDGASSYAWGKRQGCVFFPSDLGEMNSCSLSEMHYLYFGIDGAALQAAGISLCGYEYWSKFSQKLKGINVLADDSPVGFSQSIARYIGGTINIFGMEEDVLSKLGVADVVLRGLVMLLNPDWGIQSENLGRRQRFRKVRSIDRLCDYLLSDLSRRLTLAEMARFCNMSERALQYAFSDRFGVSPFSWINEQRVLRAREMIVRGEFRTIASLAEQLGFVNSSRFAFFYRRRFGQAPTQD